MDVGDGTAALRRSAPHWSLAADAKLLEVMQDIHQNIISKCQVANSKMSEMAAALDDASVHLQNVNNKFMALSNSQFIESRVYEDDADVTTETSNKEQPKPPIDVVSELTTLKQSLEVLESMHETVTILQDSGSETDSEDEQYARTVLKPKDVYAERPLPFIIGSNSWKTKWHAGLLPEDSDSDSSSCKHTDRQTDQYSDSETERDDRIDRREQIDKLERRSSSSESSLTESSVSAVKPSPADVAAQLASRLAANAPKRPEVEEEYSPPPPTTNKIYRPEQPPTSTIFSDEPPPLDDENDIFAELRKNQPYSHTAREHNRVTDDLFGGLDYENESDEGDIFSGFNKKPPQNFTQSSNPHTSAPQPQLFSAEPPPATVQADTGAIKKPVGGISLFGTNQGAESIGAAILKRNRRKSSSDDTGSDVEAPTETPKIDNKPEVINEVKPVKKEVPKDIFDDLFAKSEKLQKNVQKDKNIEKVKVAKEEKKVDLFSDNLFDDIDDIFTSSIKKGPAKDKNTKSLFDDDDDDLFSEVAVTKTNDKTKSDNKKSLFDSDDDLFSESVKETTKTKNESTSKAKSEPETIKAKTRSIFDDDSDIEILKNEDIPKVKNESASIKSAKTKSIFDDESDTETAKTNIISKTKNRVPETSKDQIKSIFDDDNEQPKTKNESKVQNKNETKATISIFDDDNNTLETKNEMPKVKNEGEKIKEVKTESIFDDESDNEIFETKKEITSKAKSEETSKVTKTKSIFDDDSDNDIFSTPVVKNSAKSNENSKIGVESRINSNISTKNNIEADTEVNTTKKPEALESKVEEPKIVSKNEIKISDEKPKFKSPSLFDDDDDDADIFSSSNTNKSLSKPNTEDNNIFGEEPTSIVSEKIPEVENEPKDDKIPEIIEKEITINKNENENDKIFNDIPIPYKDDENDNLSDHLNEWDDDDDTTNSNLNTNNDIVNDKKDTVINNNEDNFNKEISETVQTDNEKPTLSSTGQESNLFTNNNETELPPEIPDFTYKEEPPLFPEPKESNSKAFFDDIFSEPPVFEKPKEPKKSKNVNALFDDDSDDEALFFKKNDATLDEKPSYSSKPNEDRLFGLFRDEPPSIDDFSDNNFESQIDDLFIKSNKSEITEDLPENVINNENTDIFATTTSNIQKTEEITDIFKETTEILEKSNTSPVKENENKVIDVQIKDKDVDTNKSEENNSKKKIGKLKSMININVNTLLPGASPKKTNDQTDGQKFTKSNEDIHSNDKIESKMVKSVSFEGEPDSNILNNKLSKERAKIQVKRRPSTRRARREAVRKSGIDFGDDSTDNSSSIDDKPTINKKGNVESPKDNIDSSKDNKNTNVTILDSSNKDLEKEQIPKPENNVIEIPKTEVKRDVKSKIVYILNDEDIFTNTKDNKPNVDTNKELIGEPSSKSKIDPPKNDKKGLFSDSEEELFTDKKNLFDDEKDIKKDVKKKEEAFKSLFGDDGDDDDDLFSVKKKDVPQPAPVRQSVSKETTITTEPVFDDPLSLLGGEDD